MNSTNYVHVVVNSPLKKPLVYLNDSINSKTGDLVQVPLGRRSAKGVVVAAGGNELTDNVPLDKIKNITEIMENDISVSEMEIKLYRWMSQYYHYPLGQLIFDSIPPLLKRPRKLKFVEGEGLPLPHKLNISQEKIFSQIRDKLDVGFNNYLIHGITGSGKTYIYMSLIKEILQQQQSVLFLLPEINLTPQFLSTFKTHLACPIYSYHSNIAKSDKYGLWKLLQSDNQAKLIVGVRSSIFLPIKNLGLIIMDEEHDGSFKQESRCTYNTRVVAMKKAQLQNIPIVLGSATPTMETYHYFKQNPERYFTLTERVESAALPAIDLIDAREREFTKFWPLATDTLKSIQVAVAKKEQVIVFVNRLGYATFIQCRGCGQEFNCPNCSVPLKYFKSRSLVKCQYCEYQDKLPQSCPVCNCINLTQKGFGTEKIEAVLAEYFPEINIERFDRDEIKNFKQLEDKLDRFARGEIDVFVGTQMLAKGHNFKNVNLVVVLGIDSQLNFPDFRSFEKAYQLLTQVSGRAGRFSKEGRVLIQTLNPAHDIYSLIQSNNFTGFYDMELPMREMFSSPPLSRMVALYFTAKNRDKLIKCVKLVGRIIDKLIDDHFNDVEMMGPKPSNIEKKVNQFTWLILLKSNQVNQLHNIIKTITNAPPFPTSIFMKIDVDPFNLH